ncbi:MAG: glycoside hydrolase N-terminal domain-containing protein [Candidatus Pristimantibacillus sp.]
MHLFYKKPAAKWTEALPLGNGRLGAMVFGGVETELLQLNEDTLYSGGPKDHSTPNARNYLPEIRRLIEEQRYTEADALCKQTMGPYTQSYLPLGDLTIQFHHGGTATDYERRLDLDDAVVTTSYRIGQIQYRRTSFISFPDQTLVLRVEASRPEALSFTARLSSPLKHKTATDNGRHVLVGQCPSHTDPSYYRTDNPFVYGEQAMQFEGRLGVSVEDGSTYTDHDGLHVEAATSATLVFSAATSFNGYNRHPFKEGKAPSPIAESYLSEALAQSYDELYQRHISDYQPLFNRVKLHLGDSDLPIDEPTDARVTKYSAQDPRMVELLFQFGRYLLIASSRPGSQAANLQGIWNKETRPPWSSNYTLNINLEMNYWLAESCNLAECHGPMLDYIGNLASNGAIIAKENYGLNGWVAHHNSDIWAQAAAVGAYGEHGDPVWASWFMAAPWLCSHLWEHYAFSGDHDYLRDQAYPVMKEAAIFCLEWLIEDEEGYLVTSPSTSPEHRFIGPDGKRAAVSKATTMDMALIRDLFTNCVAAAKELAVEEEFCDKLNAAWKQLLPYQIGKYGQLQEWSSDFEDENVNHRHVSHLFGVYPGAELMENASESDIDKTQRLAWFHAAKTSLERRGDEGTGWSLAWKLNLWARFGDGNRAHGLISNLLRLVQSDEGSVVGGGVYPNLFDAHPPFQIDGNFGYSAGVAEMLLQSHNDVIRLLPALPDAWHTGEVQGLRARGGYVIGIIWSSGVIESVELTAQWDGICRIASSYALTVDDNNEPVMTLASEAGTVPIPVKAGGKYIIKPIMK